MREIGLVIGLLLCASYEGRAEAKKFPPPTRSQAFADCQARVPGETECWKAGRPKTAQQAQQAADDCIYQVRNCEQLLKTAESAFLAGRWHPSQGPWANCGERGGGSPYGRSWEVQCSYLDNIDKDPEFMAIMEADAKRKEKRKEREAAWEEEKVEIHREAVANAIAEMDQTLAQAAASIPESIADVRPVGSPCARVETLLAGAEDTIRLRGSLLGDRRAGYEAEIRTLEARCAANWRRLRDEFVIQESKSFSKLTRGTLRQYSPSKLTQQADTCDRVRALASESLADPDSERGLPRALSAAHDKAAKCVTMCEELRPRAEETRTLMLYLCEDYPEQQRALTDVTRRKNQIDRESGTRNLALDRELAEQRILLREERDAALRRLKQLGAPYSKSKCSRLE